MTMQLKYRLQKDANFVQGEMSFKGARLILTDSTTAQYIPRYMHTVCAVCWLSNAVASSGLQCMGRVWDYAHL